MLRNLAWQVTDTLTRAQLQMVRALSDAINLSGDDQRRALDLTQRQWRAWTSFLVEDRALPAEPPLPEMLQRLGAVAFNLSTLLERRSVTTERRL